MRPNGFTLFEIVLALALAALVIETAAYTLDQLETQGRHIQRDATDNAREGTGNALLTDLLANAMPSNDTTQNFAGDTHFVQYRTRCAEPAGWSTTCVITLLIDSTRDSSIIYAQTHDGGLLPLHRQLGTASFLFLGTAGADSTWNTTWRTAVTIPAALGITSAHDTTVLPIGAARD
ncbi:MAG TPA: hypothetical protein VN706_25205 [Gemmatimonadaceae bacterium]|nr:hypothetical protein [Gemmatimonadaceae bacterium]